MSRHRRETYLVPDPEGVAAPPQLLYAGHVWVMRPDGLYHDWLNRRHHGQPLHPRSFGWFVNAGYSPYPVPA